MSLQRRAVLAVAALPALAQGGYAQRPLKFFIPNAPASSVDTRSKGDRTPMASAGFQSLHLPYRGGSLGVLAAETDSALTPAPAAMSVLAGDRLRLLGHRLPVTAHPLGDTPSIAATVPVFGFPGWIGLLAPRGLPSQVSATLVDAVAKALRVRELVLAFELNGAVATPCTPTEFRAFLERDIALNRRAIAIAGIQPE